MLFKSKLFFFMFLIMLLSLSTVAMSQGDQDFFGEWSLVPEKSSEIALYGTLSLNFQKQGSNIMLIQKWGARRSFCGYFNLQSRWQCE